MKFADLLPQVLKPAAKAIAVLVAAWIVAGLAWLADTGGVDVGYDPGAIEAVVTSVLLALVAYITTNVDA